MTRAKAAVVTAATLGVTALWCAPASAAEGATVATARPGAAASAYTYTISARSCSSSGLSFNARQVEHGLSGTQRFKQVAQLQRRSGSRWVAATSRQTVFSVKFGNTGASKAFNRHWVGSHSTAGHYRIVWQGYWLNGRNVVLAHSPQVVGVSC